MELSTSLRHVPGIGPARAGALAEAGYETVGDLLYHLPFRYEDRREVRPVSAAAGAVAGAASSVAAAAVAAAIVFSPVPEASARMEGVHEDLLRAVQLNQITEEQALKFEARLAGRILGGA